MLFYLVDDHQMFAEALKNIIEGFGHNCTVRVFPDARPALEQLKSENPNLIILDLEMEGMGGTDMLKILSQHGLEIPVLVCSGNLTPHNMGEIKAAGARGFLRKSESITEVKEAIIAVIEGGYYPPEFRDALTGKTGNENPLSPRQQAILTLMKSGMSNGEIADMLFLSPNTIKTHVRLMYDTLNVSSRIECLNKARSLGL
ncbi:MAG: response regulator transcription factor [Thalassolituus maritimus]|uniref:Two component transcriptional regulator, LuxR family n=1 Tax=Thalassolituus maritimus TaxID=484498 RepID=A0A1N7MYT0_9GAMM|nr:response regulator transcription factor [Thalassolituus maritimus]TPD55415.1 MAG: response regulator transcription factor [Thalassolituus maritimus]SIS91232.1 two component transcriptional regulator, LuxR family [Thalassolituus maritimus]